MATSYRVKVVPPKSGQPRTALFGGAGICEAFESDLTLLLHLTRSGASITLYVKSRRDGEENKIGTMRPGETFAVRLEKVLAVTAEAAEDTQIQCTILTPAAPTMFQG